METMPSNKGTKWSLSNRYGIKDFYKHYKSSRKKPLTGGEYSKVVNDCIKLFVDEMVDNGRSMRFPRMSTMQVVKSKYLNTYSLLDCDTINETGEIKHKPTSYEYKYKGMLRWYKYNSILVCRSLYDFKPTRDIKNRIKAILKEPQGHVIYNEK